jgi:hypothetical protein
MLRGFAGAAAVGMLVLAITPSCGDDETASGAQGPSTVGTGGGGQGGDGGMGGIGGMGGGPPMLNCDDDQKCKSTEDCACPDCWYEQKCNAVVNCIDDGVCEGEDACFCADCEGETACADYCISCLAAITYVTDTSALCTRGNPSSAAIYQDLEGCACGGCIAECGGSFCQGLFPSQACIDCMDMSCMAEQQACAADVPTFIQCNPVTAEPCNLNERCDLVYVADTPIGFQCIIADNNSATCESCTYVFGSDTYCEAGNTCVDASGQVAAGGTCARYCCNDGDCGTGSCVPGLLPAVPELGVCLTMTTPACDAPAMAPSMGACVTPTD